MICMRPAAPLGDTARTAKPDSTSTMARTNSWVQAVATAVVADKRIDLGLVRAGRQAHVVKGLKLVVKLAVA